MCLFLEVVCPVNSGLRPSAMWLMCYTPNSYLFLGWSGSATPPAAPQPSTSSYKDIAPKQIPFLWGILVPAIDKIQFSRPCM